MLLPQVHGPIAILFVDAFRRRTGSELLSRPVAARIDSIRSRRVHEVAARESVTGP